MVEDGIHIGWKDTLILIVHLDGRICPPKEGLRQRCAVAHTSLYLKIGTTGSECETCHALLMEHLFHLVHPYRYRAVGILLNVSVYGHEGGWTMMLRPVELNATADPRTDQTNQRWLDDMVVIDKVALLDLVVGHLHATAQLGQHHHLDIFVFQPDGLIVFVHLFIADGFYDRIRINNATRPLIDSFLQEHRTLFRLSHLIGGNRYYLSPSFYHNAFLFLQ